MDILGDFAAGSTIDYKWGTMSGGSGSVTRATNGTIRIYKNNSTTERTSAAGITDTEDFDATTGLHHLRIDLADNTDAGFYAAGNEYFIVVAGMVLEGLTLNVPLASFSIARVGGLATILETVDALPSGAVLSARFDTVDAAGTTTQSAISNVVADVWDEAIAGHLAAGSTGLALNSAGGAGDPWSTAIPGAYGAGTAGKILGDNVNATVSSRASQTTLDTLDNFVDTEVADIQARLPAALVSGRMDASVGAMAANVMTAAAAAADLTTELQTGLATAAALTTVDDFLDTEIADIQARLPAALSAGGFMKSDLQTLLASVTAVNTLSRWGTGILAGAADSGTTTTLVDAGLTQATDVFAGSIILFYSGTNIYASRVISSFTPGTDTVAWVEPLPNAVTTENFIILPGGSSAAATLVAIADLPTNAEFAASQATSDDAILAILGTPAGASLAADIEAGGGGGLDAAGVRAAVGLAAADLDAQLAAADDAVVALLGTPLNGSIALDIAGISAGSGLDAAGVRAAVGLAEANLDTQLTGPLAANVTKVNDIAVTGLGTREFPWKPV